MSIDSKYRIGCDIGGTFTDVVVLNEETGEVTLVKEPTTPKNPEVGAISSIKRAIKVTKLDPKRLSYLCHATTIATNAIIGQSGLELPRIGFITTEGFRDLVEIGRQIRPNPYDFFTDKPRPLVPRHLRKEVPERINYNGEIIKALDEEEVKNVVRELRAEDVSSIAVCTLFSFLNPIHERRIGEIIRKEFPEASTSLSHEVLPEFREYERANTTIIDAALFDIVNQYLVSFEDKLREIGLSLELLLMQSSGWNTTSKMARKSPVYIIESGPAAGAMAAAYMGKMMGIKDVVSFDMGGTTTKTCLIEDNSPKITKEFEVGGRVAGGRVVKGSGWPIRVPVIDLVEIGAGGGSMAWIDAGGALKVGPRSAGADPGPACYGMGGLEPTITDAYVALGVINTEYFIGGELRIDKDLALTAIEEKIGRVFGMDVIKTSSAIAEVANSNMARALRLVSIERGRNPKELVMMAFGGAGPMVAGRLMDELEFRRVVVPEAPGLFSAYGLLVSDIGYDYSLTRIRKTNEVDANVLNTEYQELKEKGIKELKRDNFPDERIRIRYFADMRYVGQSYELNISIPNEKISKQTLEDLDKRFHITHEKRYGYSAVNELTEIVNLRVSAIGLMPIIKPRVHKKVDENPEVALKTFREVYFRKTKSFVNCPVYDRYKLRTGNRIGGPAIIEQLDSTIVIQPKHVADIDKFNQVVLTHQ